MFFSDVAPQSAWQPESAARYNAVNALLRSGNIPEPSGEAAADDLTDVYNDSKETIHAFAPAAVTGAFQDGDHARLAGKALLKVMPAVDDSLPWGVATQDILPGSCGVMVLSGAVPAHFTGSGRFVTPSDGGLRAGESGNALMVLTPENDLPGLILLGGAGSSAVAADDYRGYFKLQLLSAFGVRIVNGFDPSSSYCGTSDVPGLSQIPCLSLELPEAGNYDIYLVFFYDAAAARYSVQLRCDLPENMAFYRYIGIFNRGKVVQSYQNPDSRMTFGDEWYLK